jgi:hypothetical protein
LSLLPARGCDYNGTAWYFDGKSQGTFDLVFRFASDGTFLLDAAFESCLVVYSGSWRPGPDQLLLYATACVTHGTCDSLHTCSWIDYGGPGRKPVEWVVTTYPQECGLLSFTVEGESLLPWNRTGYLTYWPPLPRSVRIAIGAGVTALVAILALGSFLLRLNKIRPFGGCWRRIGSSRREESLPIYRAAQPTYHPVVSRCSRCDGTRRVQKTCPDCDGGGFLLLATRKSGVQLECSTCNRTGVVDVDCREC